MYNLIVSFQAEEHLPKSITVDLGRFLEYTDSDVLAWGDPPSVEGLRFLQTLPTVVMTEGRSDEVAYVCSLQSVEVRQDQIIATIDTDQPIAQISNDDLWRLSDELGIGNYEFSRNHWAVKPIALRDVTTLPEAVIASVREHGSPPSNPDRLGMLRIRDVLSELSHSDLDDLAMVVGNPAAQAIGRDAGSRKDRADSFIRFLNENRRARSHDGAFIPSLIERFVAERGIELGVSASPPKSAEVPASRPESHSADINRVFVVHGHNERIKDDTCSFLREIGAEPIVLHERPNAGEHLLGKFIREARPASFAVILMTADDWGAPRSDQPSWKARARQNVILELGYFLSHLTSKRICALVEPDVETPSDFDGMVYVKIEDGSEGWKSELHRELLAAGIPVCEMT